MEHGEEGATTTERQLVDVNFWDLLPDELLLKIFRNLQGKGSWLCAAALVNRRWHAVATYRHLWRSLAVPLAGDHDDDDMNDHLCWASLGDEVRQEVVDGEGDDYDEDGAVIEWRKEIIARAVHQHHRWLADDKECVWQNVGCKVEQPMMALRPGGKVCHSVRPFSASAASPSINIRLPSHSISLHREFTAVAWPTDELLLVSHRNELELFDVATRQQASLMTMPEMVDVNSVMIGDGAEQVAHVATSTHIFSMDYRSGGAATHQVTRSSNKANKIHLLACARHSGGEHNHDDDAHLLCLVTDRNAELWDLRMCQGPAASCVPSDNGKINTYNAAALHGGALLLNQKSNAGHTFNTWHIAGGELLQGVPFGEDHFLGQIHQEPVSSLQFDRHKYVMSMGQSCIVLDRATSRQATLATTASGSGGLQLRVVYCQNYLLSYSANHGLGRFALWDCAVESSLFPSCKYQQGIDKVYVCGEPPEQEPDVEESEESSFIFFD